MAKKALKIGLWVSSLAACAAGIILLGTGYREKSTFEKAKAPLAYISADPSSSGTYSTDISVTSSMPNKLIVGLLIDDQTPSLKELTAAIADFEGSCSLASENGKEAISTSSVDTEHNTPVRDKLLAIFPMSIPQPGQYTLELEVTKGIDNKELFDDKFVVYYGFCGLEAFTAQMLNCVGYILLIMSAVVMAVLLGIKKYRSQKEKTDNANN